MKPISKTAFYCCGVRMEDAESENPLLGDTYARTFMNEAGLEIFRAFEDEPWANAGNVARHRIIDDYLRNELKERPNTLVVLIGTGFDSRAFRLNGGRWLELDEPPVINYKNEKLSSVGCKNELHRLPIDFSQDSLEEVLAPYVTTDPVIVVVEGVIVYLEQKAIERILETVAKVFPSHQFICDLLTAKFYNKYARPFQEKIMALGTSLKYMKDRPQELFQSFGYTCVEKISITSRSKKFATAKPALKVLMRLFFSILWYGHSIYLFRKSA